MADRSSEVEVVIYFNKYLLLIKCVYMLIAQLCTFLLQAPTQTFIKKRLVFEIQISHNYSDLIVLNCVELMIRDKKCLIYKRDQSVMSHK